MYFNTTKRLKEEVELDGKVGDFNTRQLLR